MLRQIFHGVCSIPKSRVIVAGAIGMLVGIEHLMATRPRKDTKRFRDPDAATASPEPVPVPSHTRLFAIRRTKSDLGYTYWVLQGFDACTCFLLFDTWQEAMDEATSRLHMNQSSRTFSLELIAEKVC